MLYKCNILKPCFSMPWMWNIVNIIKPSHKRMCYIKWFVLKYPKHFFLKWIFIYTIVIVKPCLRTPAYMKCWIYILFAPFHYCAKFIPIVNFFKFHLLNGSTGNYHSVISVVFDFIKCIIKFSHMNSWNIFWFMAFYLKKVNINLKRRITE